MANKKLIMTKTPDPITAPDETLGDYQLISAKINIHSLEILNVRINCVIDIFQPQCVKRKSWTQSNLDQH